MWKRHLLVVFAFYRGWDRGIDAVTSAQKTMSLGWNSLPGHSSIGPRTDAEPSLQMGGVPNVTGVSGSDNDGRGLGHLLGCTAIGALAPGIDVAG
jgi:hypothetical protein